jgi:hypothetical protein
MSVPILAFGLLLLGLPLVAVGLSAVVVSLGPVRRARLDRFVSRTGVRFTAANAPYVLDALARAMRWRTAGVVLASAACLAWAVLHESLTLSTYTGVVLAAFFLAGCVVGEVGNAVSRGAGPRTASLEVRREEDYVGAWAARWPLVAGLLSLPLALLDIAARGDVLSVVPLATIALGSWTVARWSTRLILERPRPAVLDLDVVAADDGLRSRALHAVGGAVVLAGSWAVVALAVGWMEGSPSSALVGFAGLVVMAVTARLAWRRATAPFLVAIDPVPALEAAPEPVQDGPLA